MKKPVWPGFLEPYDIMPKMMAIESVRESCYETRRETTATT